MVIPSFAKKINYSRSFDLGNGETETITLKDIDVTQMTEQELVDLRETSSNLIAKISEAYEKGLING